MTKPVQTEARKAAITIIRLEYEAAGVSWDETRVDEEFNAPDDIDQAESIIQQAIDAALLQVRREMEKLAAQWNGGPSGAKSIAGAEVRCASELLSLAATLGNQGK